ncbi:NAD(P)/FAD-dependent oxidoreductase [Thermogladius sp.]|uniref:NAD(P)/FAD-dependent oxidoreductase n=1 Tax=Thermogladius sp. TaxID=2023064 RepID=UPI003D11B61F
MLNVSFKLKIVPVKAPTKEEVYDVVIVGGGPAGLTAALYSARYELKTVVVTKLVGGYVTEATIVDDYPGLPDIPGEELVNRFVNHVKKYNVPIIQDEVVDMYRKDKLWCVKTAGEKELCGYAVIIAVGSEKRKLNVKGEEEFSGRGVSYCATCDGPLFKDKIVAVVGGGNSALTSAIYLASLASKVYLIHRRDEFRAFRVYVEKALNNPKIEILKNSVVREIIGDTRVRAVRVENRATDEERVIEVDGVFVEIGLKPPREFFEKIGLEVDETGHAVVKVDRSTNLEGVFVAGDAAGGPYKYRFEQIITAAADGAIAADAAFKYILSVKKT